MALILVVDDSVDDLAFITEFLKSVGLDCRLASSGRDALEMLSLEKFHLVLSDLQMENGDGAWLLEEMKNTFDPPPFILMTADRNRSELEFIQKGASGFIHKPIIWHQLKLLLDRVLVK